MSANNTNLFYDYYRKGVNDGKVSVNDLSSYHTSILFDFDTRTLWHQGRQFGNAYWRSYFGESFNDFLHNTASGDFSHAEGSYTYAGGTHSHAEGSYTYAIGNDSHAEGSYTYAGGLQSHASGIHSSAYGIASTVLGSNNVAYGNSSIASGDHTITVGANSIAEGLHTIAVGAQSHSLGSDTSAYGINSIASGTNTVAYGNASHVEGANTKTETPAIGSHAEGWETTTKNEYSHTEGRNTEATGKYSHAEGFSTHATGLDSHAEGKETTSIGESSHAEGLGSKSIGNHSHAEGNLTEAIGECSHAEGKESVATGKYSHVQGSNTQAFNDFEFACGTCNVSKTSDKPSDTTVFTIGNGTPAQRHNIIDIRQNGDMHKNGNSYFNNDVYGPVSHTYVASLGKDAELDIILSSLLTQPQYTKPVIQVRYNRAAGNTVGSFTTSSFSETVEIGTKWQPGIEFSWPTRKSSSSGTRAENLTQDGDKIQSYLLGYSYGVNGNGGTSEGLYYRYNLGGSEMGANYQYASAYSLSKLYKDAQVATVGAQTTYTMFDNISVSYLESSYMFFQQLYDKGVYVIAKGVGSTAWIDRGTFNSTSSHTVTGKYRYYWGFGNSLPNDKNDLLKANIGFLNWTGSADTTISKSAIGTTNAAAYKFWVAYPDETNDDKYYLGKYSDKLNICIHQPDGIEFDLVTPFQPVQYKTMEITLGTDYTTGSANTQFKRKYKVAYINFQTPIGNPNDGIFFKITSNSTNRII